MNKLFKTLVLSLGAFGSLSAIAETIVIGVMAKRGAVRAMEQWKPTADYLTQAIPGHTFEMVTFNFETADAVIEEGKVDFFLTNPSMYVKTKVLFKAEAIATMINSRQGQPVSAFGAVMITQYDNDGINTITDLKGKSFMGVNSTSFGGWEMAYKEMLEAGLNPTSELELEFGGTHDNVVLSVMNAAVDAGTVRTDTLERMQSEGLIDIEDFKIINAMDHDGFPFHCSTVLYPEWPFVKLSTTPDEVSSKVAEALMKMSSDDPAAKAGNIVGWVDAMDYSSVKALQQSLNVGAFAAK